MRKMMLLVAVLALSASIYSVAVGQDTNPGNDPRPQPKNVAGTTAGMPPTAQVMYAAIAADGTTIRRFPNQGAPGYTSTHLGTGAYEVLFGPRDLTKCVWNGSISLSTMGGSTPASTITLAGRAGTTDGVFINTFDSTGALADRAFHLTVSC